MKGFFDKVSTPLGACGVTCKLNRTCRNANAPASGKGARGVYVVMHSTSSRDVDTLRAALRRVGLDLDRDCWLSGPTRCSTPGGRPVEAAEIAACRPHVVADIQNKKPALLLLLGDAAAESVLGFRWTRDSVGGVARWRGCSIPDQVFRCWIAVSYAPEAMEQEKTASIVRLIWDQDLTAAASLLKKKVPIQPEPVVSSDPREVVRIMTSASLSAVDFETTGKKPDVPGHYIKSIGVASATHCAACLLAPIKKEACRYLGDPARRKVNHNIKYEDRWAEACLDVEVAGWIWCTQMASHVLDNRTGHVNSLKFQVYVKLGVCGYDDGIDFGNSKGSNDINDIELIPVSKLLLYNALDARYAFDLAMVQMFEGGINCATI